MNTLRQKGILLQSDSKELTISLHRPLNCADCAHTNNCSALACDTKIIKLPRPHNFIPQTGQELTLQITQGQSQLAIFLCFVVPLVLLISSLAIMLFALQQTENISALIALGILSVYYIILFLLKKRLNKIFTIQIIPEELGE